MKKEIKKVGRPRKEIVKESRKIHSPPKIGKIKKELIKKAIKSVSNKKKSLHKNRYINEYVCVRSYDAGVFVGKLIEKNIFEKWVLLDDCRRIWRWDGACSLSELSVDGIKEEGFQNCKFPIETDNHTVLNVCEIIPVSTKALKSIKSVKYWKYEKS